MRDDYEFNAQFCQLMELHPELYDFTMIAYSNKCAQDAAWQSIADELKESVSDCKDRWRNIRARYGKNLKDRKKKDPKKFVKEYYLAPLLKFLENFIKIRSPKRSRRKAKEIEEKGSDDDDDNDDDDEGPSSPTEENIIPYKQRRVETPDAITLENDEDLSFLTSVLPDMKAMTDVQKRQFKIKVLSLADDILDGKSNDTDLPFEQVTCELDPIKVEEQE